MVQLPVDGTLTAEAIETTLSHNLQVLSMDTANLLCCHAPDETTPIAERAKIYNDQSGEYRFGSLVISNCNPSMSQEWLETAERQGYVNPSIFQGQYNLFCRASEDKLCTVLGEHFILFDAYSPLADDFLRGIF